MQFFFGTSFSDQIKLLRLSKLREVALTKPLNFKTLCKLPYRILLTFSGPNFSKLIDK